MKTILRPVTIALLAAFAVLPAGATIAGTSYTGQLATDDAYQVFSVTLPAAGPLIIQTYSYAGGTNHAGTVIPGGGFDPTISVYDAQGNYLTGNRDGGCGNAAADATTGFCWDSYLSLSLPAGTYQVAISQSENLPNGPTLASSFVYSGQTTFTTPPTPAGTASPGFWDLYPSKRTSFYSLDILGGASTVTAITSSSAVPSGTVGRVYSPFTFTAAAASGATLTWSITSGSLPAGITLNSSTGVLSGTPQAAGTFPITVQVTDGGQPVVTQNVSLIVYSPVVITTTSLPSGTGGQAYSTTLGASNGSGSYLWSESGALPAGLTLSPAGTLGGTPTQSGAFPVSITVNDTASGLSATVSFTITIAPATLTMTSAANLGEYVPGGTIAGTFGVTGGVGPYKWSATGLPLGLVVNGATGAYSGTGGNPGVYSFTIQVADSETPAATASATETYSVLGITTSALPGASTTAAYTATLAATGGTAPYSFSAASLPAGLTLSPAGVLGGTPKSVGTFSFAVSVKDQTGLTSSTTFVLTVTGPAIQTLTVTTTPPAAGTALSPYSAPGGLQATGGVPPYTWSLFSGILPAGMSLSGSGSLLGTPAAAGSYVFAAQVTDSTGATAVGNLTLTINPAVLSLALGTFPNGVAGVAYPLQILSKLASGGTPAYRFSVTAGSLPAGLTLTGQEISGTPTTQGTSTFTITVTDAAGATASAQATIVIGPSQNTLILSQSSVSFSLTAGASGVPTPAAVPVRSSTVASPLGYSFSVSPAVSWLDVSGGGTTPGALRIALDPSSPTLAASSTPYTTVIAVCTGASPCGAAAQNITVSLTVSAPPAQLTLSNSVLSFNASSANPAASVQSLGLQNTGGGVINISSIVSGSSWLTITGSPSTLAAGPGTSIQVTANPAGLSAGYYRTTITVNSSVGDATVPVTLLVEAGAIMTLGPAGTQFTAPAGSSPGVPGGSFNVSVSGSSAVNWTASLAAGTNWLNLSTVSGTATADAAGVVNYTLDAGVIASLAPGAYYATILVSAPDSVDTPQEYGVVLNVTPASTPVVPLLSTAGLVFVSSATGTTGPQTVLLYSGATSALSAYQASASTTDGNNWLSVSPATGTAYVQLPTQTSVAVNVSGLAAGIYSGTVSYALAGDGVRTVNVTLLVVNSGLVPAARSGEQSVPAASCTPSRLIATQTGLYGNFAQPAGWPAPLSVNLINDCGSPVNGAQLTTTFSNGDPPLALSPKDSVSGIYLGTWTPRNPAPQVTVTATATSSPYSPATTQVTGEVQTNSAPILSPNGTFDVYSGLIGQGLAPGEAIQIYGTNLASQTVVAASTPLPTSLGGTSVLIGGIPAPLYFVSSGQVNAQVPYQLTPGIQYQILVQTSGAYSTPQPFQVIPAAPGIANLTGSVIAQHAATYGLISEASPAQPGEYVVLYLSGLGGLDNPVATGAASTGNPLSHPLITPTLTLNGTAAPIAFAGLTPGLVGLYQINFQIPAGTPNGDLTLLVNQNGMPSNEVIIPVHN